MSIIGRRQMRQEKVKHFYRWHLSNNHVVKHEWPRKKKKRVKDRTSKKKEKILYLPTKSDVAYIHCRDGKWYGCNFRNRSYNGKREHYAMENTTKIFLTNNKDGWTAGRGLKVMSRRYTPDTPPNEFSMRHLTTFCG